MKVAWPAASVVPETVVTVDEPEPCVSVTALPATGWPYASFSVTVSVEVEEPSAVSEAGEAARVEADALTAPTVKETAAVSVTSTESVVSCAV